MAFYRIMIPVEHRAAIGSDDLAERVHRFLEDKDFYVEGVSVENVMEINGQDDATLKVEGPFLVIDCNQSPRSVMAEFEWFGGHSEDDQLLLEFIDSEWALDHPKMVEVIKTLARRQLGLK